MYVSSKIQVDAASLVVVGSGIKFVSHLTSEARAYIRHADIVLYLVNDPAMKTWIQQNHLHAESLETLYTKYPLRIDCYRAITSHILATLRVGQHVCVVTYGHPVVYAQSTLDAVLQAKKEGYDAKALPGISALDCLYADLLIDPGACGCQSFDATDFLLRHRRVDPSSHLILLQIGYIGAIGHHQSDANKKGIRLLVDYLEQEYPIDHEVLLYEAAQYAGFHPRVERLPLQKLSEARFSPITTLYVPPVFHKPCDRQLLTQLHIKPEDLQ